MKRLRYVQLASLLVCVGLAACSEESPRDPLGPDQPAGQLSPDDLDGGGGGGGTGGGTTAPQYRIEGQVYPIDRAGTGMDPRYAKMRGWSRFEQLVNGSWVKVDAGSLSIQCYGGGSSDSDQENGAGFTDVEFWIGPAPAGYYYTVQCYHTAVHNGVTYTTTSSYGLTMT
jgi:hypothetical protein